MADANLEEAQQLIEEAKRDFYERHQKDRESLLANEGFAISMQQVVSGALLLGALSKWGEIVAVFGPVQVLAVVVVAGVGLIAAVLAAQLRHDYRMWNVKGTTAALADGDAEEGKRRFGRANRYLRAMRIAMWTSTVAIVIAVLAVLGGAWFVAVLTTMPAR